ncbi:hypothetical protein [uncultured Fibrobacter sp.]|uniref:hypothetical protein n=1 Tax=uncultured Fibrobacter sp. TaxID=261512 RepID=UPI0025F2F124|nr:hypothetical protein [uncultured Fibrobacter sp.]
MAIQYAPLFALETQFQTKDGRNNTGGWLKVFLAATDDPATTYSDYNGTRNPEKIVLDDDGRALVICDKSKAYRLEVYDINGMLLWTEEPVYCSGTGGGGVSITKVISTDGSIAIDESVVGSTTTYDIGLAPRDNDEFLEWIKCSEEDCGSTWYPEYQEGTMETEAGQGVKVHKGQLYHFTNSFTVDPNGSGINYDTFRVTMYCGDDVVDERDFDIDSSLNDTVLCEFSRDVVPSEDTHVYFKLSIPATCEVSGEVQAHRIYSGINAVPDTCATKQWVQETFDYNLSSKVDYSAIGYNEYGQISGISGSAIAGGMDSATVSSIASSVASAYTESAFSSISSWTADLSSISSKADQSALTAYQPVSAMSGYATEAYVDARMGDKLDATASSLFLTGLPDDLATTGDVASAVSGKMDKADGSAFYPMTGNPSGFLTAHQSLAGLATVEYVDSSVSSKLDTSAFASASAGFAPTGDYAYNSSLSAYYPASASGAFQPSGQYQTAGDYALNSAVSAKLDASASSNFVVNSAMTSWIPYSALDYSGTAISGIGGSSLAGMGGGADYTGIYPVNVDNTARTVAVDSLPLVTDSSMTAYGSAGSSVIGVNLDIMSSKQDTLAFSYDDDKISAINGSAIAGGGDYVENSALDSATARSAKSTELPLVTGVSSISGKPLLPTLLAQPTMQYGGQSTFAYMPATSMWTTADAATGVFTPLRYATGACLAMDAGDYFKAYYKGNEWFVSNTQYGMLRGEIHQTRGLRIVASGANSASGFELNTNGVGGVSNNGSAWQYGVSEYNNLTSVHDTVSSNSAAWGQGGVVTSVESGTSYTGTTTAVVTGITGINGSGIVPAMVLTGSFRHPVTNKNIYGYKKLWNLNLIAESSTLAGCDNKGRWISALPDSATVSSIASSYAESAASSKLDTTAFNSGDFYSTANPSGFITGVDLTPYQTTADMSSYIPTSMSSDFQQASAMSSYALSSDVSATVDLVGTQSANWGGSALALSAGPGVTLTKSGNVLVAGLDETVLFNSVDGSSISTITASENVSNFERLRFYWYPWTPLQGKGCQVSEVSNYNGGAHYTLECGWIPTGNPTGNRAVFIYMYSSDGTAFTQIGGGFNNLGSATNWSEVNDGQMRCYKIVGINRTAEA